MPPRQQKHGQQARRPRKRRTRYPETPAEQTGSDAAYPDEDDEDDEIEVKAGVMEPSSDAEMEAEADDVALALDLEQAQHMAAEAQANLGAEQAREEGRRSLRSAAQQLQGQDDAKVADGRVPQLKAKGKLPRPSANARPSTAAKPASTRKLATLPNVRKSVYDLAGTSPRPRLQPTATAAPAPFSPLRKQAKAAQSKQQPDPHPSPRRSSRGQGLQADEGAVEAADAAQTQSAAHIMRPHGGELDAEAGAEPATQLVIDGEKDPRGGPAAVQPPVTSSANGEPVEKRKRGRPPKHASANDAQPRPQQRKTSPVAQNSTAKPQTPSSLRAQWRVVALEQKRPQSETPKPAQILAVPAEQPRKSQRASMKALSEKQQTDDLTDHSRHAPPATQKSAVGLRTRRSSRRDEAKADLDRRRNAQEDADPTDADEAGQELADRDGPAQEGPDDIEDELSDKPRCPRPNELRFPDTPNDGEELEEAAGSGAAGASKARNQKKRKAGSQLAQANTGAKRRKTANPEDDEYEDAEEHQPAEERLKTIQQRLWGQWLPLKRIHRDIKYVGCNTVGGELRDQNEIVLRDPDVKAAVHLCNEAMQRYQNLAGGNAEDSEPASVLTDLGRRVDGLRGRDEDFPTDFNSKRKVTNIYSHLVPALVKLIWHAVTCYEAIDRDEVPAGRISMDHLLIVKEMIKLTRNLEESAAKKYEARPDTSDAVVKAVHNGIAVPLRDAYRAFQDVLQRHDAEVQATREREQEAQDRALRLEQEERRARQSAELNRIREKWENLHTLRMRVEAEGGLMRPAKMKYLAMPDPNLDMDANGNLFRRVALFHPRVGPAPGILDVAKGKIWSEGELRALTDGLRVYAGPLVYEKIMRAWCRRDYMLNKYNVIDIVAAAENVKSYYEKALGEEMEDWMKAIPVWSKSHAAGEENEDSFEDIDEVLGGDDEGFLATAS